MEGPPRERSMTEKENERRIEAELIVRKNEAADRERAQCADETYATAMNTREDGC
jgi:hypothetical protein